MKKIISIFLILMIFFMVGCSNTKNIKEIKKPLENEDSSTSEINSIGTMDEELNTESLDSLEEDLKYIKNI